MLVVIYMSIIKQMDSILANKIAAGEVVERCASVVKELVENAIDAGATEIKVDLLESGTREIRVIDNGKGMDKDDAVMAFNRHATSKLLDEEELYHINTLGFRGEALASICSVSKVNMRTSQGNIGTIVEIDGGKIISVTPGDARKGTIITVSDLFYNTPARLKYMKSLYTELASITEYINKISLSHPEIRFSLTNNGSKLLNTDGTNNLLKTIKEVYGINITKKMLYIEGTNNDYKVYGYISLPEIMRSNRNNMVTLVNGRVVRNNDINKTINDSYSNFQPDNRYPIVVLNIETDPSLIDVNVHPTKMDVKFSKIDVLEELITNLIKNKLSHKDLIPEIELVKKEEPKINIFDSIYKEPKYEEQTLDLARKVSEDTTYEPNNYIINDDLTDSMAQEAKDCEDTKKLPELYPVGLVRGTYIICQNDLGMYLIDQHAAKERINYEHYREVIGHPDHKKISLLVPITIEYTNNEFIILKENFDVMRNMGFDIDEFGINSVIIKSTPTWLPEGYEEDITKKIIDVLLAEEHNFDLAKFNEHVSATVSCKASIKANTSLTMPEMENIIDDLRKCKNPFNCPHGRPTIIFYSKDEIEKQFKRSGF